MSPAAPVMANTRQEAFLRRRRPRAASSALDACREALDSRLEMSLSSKALVRPVSRARRDARIRSKSNALVSAWTRGSPIAARASPRPCSAALARLRHWLAASRASLDASNRSDVELRDCVLRNFVFIIRRLPRRCERSFAPCASAGSMVKFPLPLDPTPRLKTEPLSRRSRSGPRSRTARRFRSGSLMARKLPGPGSNWIETFLVWARER